jgi:hypothetical protein
VAAHQFFFALEFSSQGVSPALLGDLASHVLGHVGCAAGSLPELPDALRRAVMRESTSGERRCDVQFRAQGGRLDIVVSANGGRIWQTSQPIPDPHDAAL